MTILQTTEYERCPRWRGGCVWCGAGELAGWKGDYWM